MSELTTEQIAEIKARRDEAYRWITTLQMTEERRRSESLLVSAERDIDLLLNAYERLREIMAWLGKGKMRPLEQRYQAFLHHDAEHGYDDTPPDYVEWLEQIAMGDIHLVETPAANMDAGQEAD